MKSQITIKDIEVHPNSKESTPIESKKRSKKSKNSLEHSVGIPERSLSSISYRKTLLETEPENHDLDAVLAAGENVQLRRKKRPKIDDSIPHTHFSIKSPPESQVTLGKETTVQKPKFDSLESNSAILSPDLSVHREYLQSVREGMSSRRKSMQEAEVEVKIEVADPSGGGSGVKTISSDLDFDETDDRFIKIKKKVQELLDDAFKMFTMPTNGKVGIEESMNVDPPR